MGATFWTIKRQLRTIDGKHVKRYSAANDCNYATRQVRKNGVRNNILAEEREWWEMCRGTNPNHADRNFLVAPSSLP